MLKAAGGFNSNRFVDLALALPIAQNTKVRIITKRKYQRMLLYVVPFISVALKNL